MTIVISPPKTADLEPRRWSALGAGLAVVTFVHVARAQVEPIRLDYTGAPECPQSAEFARGVFGRTTRARPAESSETSVRTFVVSITRSGGGFVGSLVVREADGKTSAREVTGAECRTVAEALALATSLAIDPNASLAAPATPAETPTNGAESPPAEPPPEPPREKPSEPAEPEPPANDWSANAALGPNAATGIGPRIAFGGSVSAGWGLRRPNQALSSFGLELTLLGSLPQTVETASSRFWFAFARPEVCTFGALLGSDVALVPCLGVELGAVTGVGADIGDAATRTRFWAALDAKLALRVELSHAWFAEAHGGAVVPFVRYDFVFRDPDTSVHSIPALGAVFGVKVGTRFR